MLHRPLPEWLALAACCIASALLGWFFAIESARNRNEARLSAIPAKRLERESAQLPADCRLARIDPFGTSHWECPEAFIGEMASD